jgi:hypothetical protein
MPPGAGVTTWWPRLLGQRNRGGFVPVETEVSKSFDAAFELCFLSAFQIEHGKCRAAKGRTAPRNVE